MARGGVRVVVADVAVLVINFAVVAVVENSARGVLVVVEAMAVLVVLIGTTDNSSGTESTRSSHRNGLCMKASVPGSAKHVRSLRALQRAKFGEYEVFNQRPSYNNDLLQIHGRAATFKQTKQRREQSRCSTSLRQIDQQLKGTPTSAKNGLESRVPSKDKTSQQEMAGTIVHT